MFRNTLSAFALVAASSNPAWADPIQAFDVAEDHTRIFMAAQPVHEDGMPAHGNAFVSQGYIYPEGTLADGTVGVLEDGRPAFPDKVLGTWTCDGYFVGEGGNTKTGVWIISRQTFAFKDGATLVTQGTEIADIGQPNLRPITGATGDFGEVEGGLIQTTLGFNDFWGLSATYTFEAPLSAPAKMQDASIGTGTFEFIDDGDNLEWDSGAPVGPITAHAPIPSI